MTTPNNPVRFTSDRTGVYVDDLTLLVEVDQLAKMPADDHDRAVIAAVRQMTNGTPDRVISALLSSALDAVAAGADEDAAAFLRAVGVQLRISAALSVIDPGGQ